MHDVLSCQFEQHGIIKELINRHVLVQSLAPPGLHHELPGQMGGGLRLEWSDNNALVERIAGHNLPVMEHGQTERLPLRVGAQVGFKTETVDRRNERLDGVEGGAGHRRVLSHMTSETNFEIQKTYLSHSQK